MTRLLWKISFAAVCLIFIAVFVAMACFSIWIGDRPDISQLERFTPGTPAEIQPQIKSDCLLTPVIAIPYSRISTSLRQAVSSDKRNAVPRQIARGLFCNDREQMLQREMKELRVAMELEQHFSSEQLLTIYFNRANFGEGTVGVQAAARRWFGCDADHLTLPQSALLVGLIRNPAFYSPERHPERALERRNAVLDAMLQQGKISATDAEMAKATPLKVVSSRTR